MGFLSRTGAIAGEGSAAGPDQQFGTRAGLVRVFSTGLLPGCFCFESRRVTVGRDFDSSLVLVDDAVSRQQAEITYASGAWTVADAGSRNGTFVNGERIERAVLKHGDLVRLGDNLFTFVRADADGYEKFAEPASYGELVGGYRVLRLVQALARVAESAIPIRLRGERGIEMDASARIIHERSGRGGELRVLRCTQRDAREIGAMLFGTSRESPRPSSSESPYRRPGDDETRSPKGTVFFDDIDIAPNMVEWIARTSARHPGYRFIFGTPSWVEESALWRYSINLVPLRDRKEDVVPICKDELRILGRADLQIDFAFVAALLDRGLDGGAEALRRSVRASVERCRGPRLTELG